jgi:hypothetical protein
MKPECFLPVGSCSVLPTVYYSWDYWVFGLCRPVFKTQRFGIWIYFRLQVSGRSAPALLGPCLTPEDGHIQLAETSCFKYFTMGKIQILDNPKSITVFTVSLSPSLYCTNWWISQYPSIHLYFRVSISPVASYMCGPSRAISGQLWAERGVKLCSPGAVVQHLGIRTGPSCLYLKIYLSG